MLPTVPYIHEHIQRRLPAPHWVLRGPAILSPCPEGKPGTEEVRPYLWLGLGLSTDLSRLAFCFGSGGGAALTVGIRTCSLSGAGYGQGEVLGKGIVPFGVAGHPDVPRGS